MTDRHEELRVDPKDDEDHKYVFPKDDEDHKAANGTWRPPPETTAWWSQGPVCGQAGVGIIVKNNFLKNFEQPPKLVYIWRGRAAKLCLRGPAGSLDLIVTYFPSGAHAQPNELDLQGIPMQHGPTAIIFLRLGLCCVNGLRTM